MGDLPGSQCMTILYHKMPKNAIGAYAYFREQLFQPISLSTEDIVGEKFIITEGCRLEWTFVFIVWLREDWSLFTDLSRQLHIIRFFKAEKIKHSVRKAVWRGRWEGSFLLFEANNIIVFFFFKIEVCPDEIWGYIRQIADIFVCVIINFVN